MRADFIGDFLPLVRLPPKDTPPGVEDLVGVLRLGVPWVVLVVFLVVVEVSIIYLSASLSSRSIS